MGDCLFDSIKICLNSININVSSTFLRKKAYQSILYDIEETREAIDHWINVYHYRPTEYTFIRPFLHIKEFSKNDHEKLYKLLCDNRYTWGEEYALRQLQKILNLAIIVFDTSVNNYHRYNIDDLKNYDNLIVLNLSRQHYTPMKIFNKYVWNIHELRKYFRLNIKK